MRHGTRKAALRMFAGVLLFVFAYAILSASNKLHIQPYGCTCKQFKKNEARRWNIPQEKSPKLPARRNISSFWPCGRTISARQKSTAFMRCAIIRASHRRNWPVHAACRQARHRPPNGQPGAKGLPSPGAESEDGRSQLLFATPQAEGLRNAKAETESAFYDYLMDGLSESDRETFLNLLDVVYRRSKAESRAGFPHLKDVLKGKTNEPKA